MHYLIILVYFIFILLLYFYEKIPSGVFIVNKLSLVFTLFLIKSKYMHP